MDVYIGSSITVDHRKQRDSVALELTAEQVHLPSVARVMQSSNNGKASMEKVALSLLYLSQPRAYVFSDVDGQSPRVTLYRDREHMSVNQCLGVGTQAWTFFIGQCLFAEKCIRLVRRR